MRQWAKAPGVLTAEADFNAGRWEQSEMNLVCGFSCEINQDLYQVVRPSADHPATSTQHLLTEIQFKRATVYIKTIHKAKMENFSLFLTNLN